MIFPGVKKAVLISAHQDDEMVAAGTLHRLVREGVEVHVIAFAQAATEDDRKGNQINEGVMLEWERAMDLIGVKKGGRSCLCFRPSSDFQPHRQTICQFVYDYIKYTSPDLVITLSPDDENPAHRIVGEEVERVARGRIPYLLRCHYPWNHSVNRPNLYVELSQEDVDVKFSVAECYQSQKFRYQYGEIFLAQAQVDGRSMKTESGYAERFELVRGVVSL